MGAAAEGNAIRIPSPLPSHRSNPGFQKLRGEIAERIAETRWLRSRWHFRSCSAAVSRMEILAWADPVVPSASAGRAQIIDITNHNGGR